MGICALKSDFTQDAGQNIRVRLDPGFMIQLDAKSFPICCPYCNRNQKDLYLHQGSRYGNVGTVTCQWCEKEILVADHDNLVHEIRIGGEWVPLDKIYFVDWCYICALGEGKKTQILNALLPYKGKFLKLEMFTNLVGEAVGVIDFPIQHHRIGNWFRFLPEDVDRWISLLEYLGVSLPDYVKKAE